MQKSKPKTVKKISKLAKAWRILAKDRNSRDKTLDFYEAFFNAQFWLKLDESEEKNYEKFKKHGIKAREKFKVATDGNGVVLLFNSLAEHKKFVEKDFKKGEKMKYGSIRQYGGELMYNLSKNTNYAVKMKGVRDFVRVSSEDVAFMKKNFGQKQIFPI